MQYACLPENDDEAVEDIETVANVAQRPVRDKFEKHLYGEQDREQQVTVLEHLCQHRRLQQHQQPRFIHRQRHRTVVGERKWQ